MGSVQAPQPRGKLAIAAATIDTTDVSCPVGLEEDYAVLCAFLRHPESQRDSVRPCYSSSLHPIDLPGRKTLLYAI